MSAAPGAEAAVRPIRDAASVVAVRRDGGEPRVLMGRRGQGAAFMPSKVVFPGGAVDPADRAVAEALRPPAALAERLGRDREADAGQPGGDAELGRALVVAALRELWEETGVALRATGSAPAAAGALPDPWPAYLAQHGLPPLEAFRFIFRAVTPPGRPRRFDARFLMIDAAMLADPDDFAAADGELSDLGWRTIAEALSEDLPFVTALVLAEIEALLTADPAGASRPAPFFRHDGRRSFIDPA